MWNPWRGCKKYSEGCLHCYIHKGDAKRGVDTSMIIKTKDFDKPVTQFKKGGYKMKPGLVYLGFSADFLIEEADAWRDDCWKMIKERADCNFLFLTKRIERFAQYIPKDGQMDIRMLRCAVPLKISAMQTKSCLYSKHFPSSTGVSPHSR